MDIKAHIDEMFKGKDEEELNEFSDQVISAVQEKLALIKQHKPTMKPGEVKSLKPNVHLGHGKMGVRSFDSEKQAKNYATGRPINESNKMWDAGGDPPAVIIMKRKAIRIFPDGKKIALYYAPSVDKYISVPYDAHRHKDKHEQGVPVAEE